MRDVSRLSHEEKSVEKLPDAIISQWTLFSEKEAVEGRCLTQKVLNGSEFRQAYFFF